MELFEVIVYSVSAISVGIYAGSEFNKPVYPYHESDDIDGKNNFWDRAKPGVPRYMTDWSRYQVFRMTFILFSIMVFFCLAFFFPDVEYINKMINSFSHPDILRTLIRPVGSAIVLLGLAKIKYFDLIRELVFERLKSWLHKFADIPAMGQRIYENLCFQPIDYNSEIATANIKNLLEQNYLGTEGQRQDIHQSDFQLGNPLTITWKWARLSYGINVIEQWSKKTVYKTQLKEPSLKWLSFRQDYVTCIDGIIRHREGGLSEDETVELNKEVEILLANCHRLIACLVFMVAKSTENPLRYLKDAGYKVSPHDRFKIKKGDFARILLALLPAILIFSFGLTILPSSISIDVPMIMTYCWCALIIMALPVYIVFSFKESLANKQKWPKVSQNYYYNSFFDMPLILYTSISLLSWGVVTVSMMLYTHHEKLQKLTEVTEWKSTAIFSFIGAVTAMFTAISLDTLPVVYSKRKDCILRWFKGALIQGLMTGAIVWVGLSFLNTTKGIPEYPLFGFTLALVLNYVLFFKKYRFDKRGSGREDYKESVIALVDGVPEKVFLINRSSSGACIKPEKKYIVEKGNRIELLLDENESKTGIIVKSTDDRWHVSFPESLN